MRAMPMRNKHASARICAVVFLTASTVAAAQRVDSGQEGSTRRLIATRTTAPITVDGVLDEPAWHDAMVATDFVQSEPREHEPATEPAEVRVLYDEVNLYIGAFLHDSDPKGIIVGDLKKDFDSQGGDAFEVIVDTFRDERNGYWFATNAMGAKWDAQMVNEGREVNADWDGVWQVRTRITEQGWYAELAIPFSTLKFKNVSEQVWGLNFLRRLRRRNEESYWAPVPRIYRLSRVSVAGTLEGFQARPRDAGLRVKPYALASGSRVGVGGLKHDQQFGLDAKYAVTNGATLDITVNTDFSQVESDEQQVNLTRVSLFFPEKREFFLENSGVFQFGAGDERAQSSASGRAATQGTSTISNSRYNEVAQTVNDVILFFSRRIGLADSGDTIPLAAGTRLTGRTRGFNIGILNIQQRDGVSTPATNFSALRVRGSIFANSDVGVAFLNKQATGDDNRVVGADANFRFFRYLNINSYTARTFSDAGRVPSGDNQTATRLGFNYAGPFWNVRSSYLAIGDGFNDEMGFVPRVGVKKVDGYLAAHVRPKAPSRWLREFNPHVEWHNIDRWNGDLDSRYLDYHAIIRFQDGSTMEPGINLNVENIVAPFVVNRKRAVVLPPGRYSFNESFVWFTPNAAARIGLSGRVGVGEFYNGQSQSYRIGAAIRESEHLNVAASVTRTLVDLPAGAFATTLMTSRVNVNFSTRMFLNSLLQYNTDAQQWSANIRFNIIHRPLSDLFLVYNEQRDTRSGDLLNRGIIGKMTYMMRF
jgi:uncharacterized protein DUF5916/cellulose/xylan binding protein with CBM9 domain